MKAGIMAALAAFLSWGFLPLFWKQLVHVSPYEVVCHRIIWSCIFTAVLLTIMGRWKEVWAIRNQKKDMLAKLLASILLFANWLVFIWAVSSDYVLEASLGYYICPLVFALLSRMIFRDTLRPLQVLGIVLALAGVGNLVVSYGHFPWIAVSLALLFAGYGLINKIVSLKPIPGLFVETLYSLMPASAYLFYLGSTGRAGFLNLGQSTDVLLVCAGVVTTLPLMGFIFAAKRLKLVTIGMCQYIVPTCFFILGVLVFDEPFTHHHLITFVLIWAGVVVYLVENTIESRRGQGLAKPSQVSR